MTFEASRSETLELAACAFAAFGVGQATRVVMKRRGRVLLMIPDEREGAARTLNLYQPQKWAARLVARVLGVASTMGLHGVAGRMEVVPFLAQPCLADGVEAASFGLLLGDPAHKVSRAIASYRRHGNWEVAKVALGEGGGILGREAAVLGRLKGKGLGVPELLGLHESQGMTVLRMPYMVGRPLPAGDLDGVVELLNDWLGEPTRHPMDAFPEWPAIARALERLPGGDKLLDRLAGMLLVPALRHGDFARWNMLRRPDGGLVALDWEWGHEAGLSGLDLVHFFAQDARLVRRLPAKHAWSEVEETLAKPCFREYLARAGWGEQIPLLMAACFAFKEGAEHQDCGDMVAESCKRLMLGDW